MSNNDWERRSYDLCSMLFSLNFAISTGHAQALALSSDSVEGKTLLMYALHRSSKSPIFCVASHSLAATKSARWSPWENRITTRSSRPMNYLHLSSNAVKGSTTSPIVLSMSEKNSSLMNSKHSTNLPLRTRSVPCTIRYQAAYS